MASESSLERVRFVVGLSAWLATSGCAPTLSRSHEAAFGVGGAGHRLTQSESSDDEPRYGADAALALRASYAHCLDKDESAVCFEIPVDFLAKRATARSNVPRASAAALALMVVQLFEVLDGFGVMTNVYDRLDLVANTAGILVAITLDVVVARMSGGR
jgi:hypothetical protein